MESLLHRLEELEAKNGNDTPEATVLLHSTKAELETLFRLEAEGAAVRARARYKLDGEKASKMFCHLEKYNGQQKFIPQVIKHVDGSPKTLTKQKDIEGETKHFYQKLYSNNDHQITENIDTFLGPASNTLPKVTPSQAANMTGHISLDEMTRYLKKTKNNVSLAFLVSPVIFTNFSGMISNILLFVQSITALTLALFQYNNGSELLLCYPREPRIKDF